MAASVWLHSGPMLTKLPVSREFLTFSFVLSCHDYALPYFLPPILIYFNLQSTSSLSICVLMKEGRIDLFVDLKQEKLTL